LWSARRWPRSGLAEVARFGLKALLAGTLVNLSNAAIAGIVGG
jgi:nucleoside permease NupC